MGGWARSAQFYLLMSPSAARLKPTMVMYCKGILREDTLNLCIYIRHADRVLFHIKIGRQRRMIRIYLCGYLVLNIHQQYTVCIRAAAGLNMYGWTSSSKEHIIVAYWTNFFVLSTFKGPGRVHREATAAFWRIFHHEGKISPAW